VNETRTRCLPGDIQERGKFENVVRFRLAIFGTLGPVSPRVIGIVIVAVDGAEAESIVVAVEPTRIGHSGCDSRTGGDPQELDVPVRGVKLDNLAFSALIPENPSRWRVVHRESWPDE